MNCTFKLNNPFIYLLLCLACLPLPSDSETVYGACYDILSKYPVNSVVPFISDAVGVGALIVALIYILTASWTFWWIRSQRSKAEVVDE